MKQVDQLPAPSHTNTLDIRVESTRDRAMDLEDYGINMQILSRMYDEWKDGAPKSELERRYLGRSGNHGKLFTSLVRRFLGKETERTHPLVKRNERLTVEISRLKEENERLRKQLRLDI